MRETAGPVLELREVRKAYPGSPPVQAVRGVTLTVRAGELAAVIGPSGSGKTTLLHLMAALDRPTHGSVRIAGQDVGQLTDRQLSGLRAHRIGVAFQRFFLIDNQSALDNVAMGLLYRGMPSAARRRRAAATLERARAPHAAPGAAAVGWRAAARRHRPRGRGRTCHRPGRRADRQSRLSGEHRHRRPAPQAERGGPPSWPRRRGPTTLSKCR